MVPAYIIDKNRKEVENEQQIQLEIPDYRAEYEEWMRKKQQDERKEEPQTVIVIDIY